MRFGAITRLQRSGPCIASAALSTIGISNTSKCWGFWLHPSSNNDSRASSKRSHLMLTSIAPDAWPYVFRSQIRLEQGIGAMAAAARVFEEAGVSILSARCTISGHRHATWNVIGEALKLKEAMMPVHYRIGELTDPEKKKKESAAITEELLSFLPKLEEQLLTANKKAKPFLRKRFLTQRLNSFEKEFFTNATLWEENEYRISRAVTFFIMPNLTHFWRHAENLDYPLVFHYDEKLQVLIPEDQDTFESELENRGFSLPTRAVASFDTDEHYVRLDILERERVKRMVVLDVSYEKRFQDPRDVIKASSLGLLREICDKVAGQDIDLYHVKNVIKNQTFHKESGILAFIGEHASNGAIAEDKQEHLLRTSIENIHGHGPLKVTNLGYLTVDPIFLSMHLGANRADTIESVIRRQVEHAGFVLVRASTMSSSVTEEVVRSIRECTGFIQVLGTREGDHKSDKEKPDIAWLIAEFFGALTLDIHALRLADRATMEAAQWRSVLKIASDSPLYMFDSRSDDLERVIAPIVDNYLSKIQ